MPPLSPSSTRPWLAMSSTRRVTGLPPSTARAVPSSAMPSPRSSGTFTGDTVTASRHSTTSTPATMSGMSVGFREADDDEHERSAQGDEQEDREHGDEEHVRGDHGVSLARRPDRGRASTRIRAGTAASSVRRPADLTRRLTAASEMPSRAAASRCVMPSARRSYTSQPSAVRRSRSSMSRRTSASASAPPSGAVTATRVVAFLARSTASRALTNASPLAARTLSGSGVSTSPTPTPTLHRPVRVRSSTIASTARRRRPPPAPRRPAVRSGASATPLRRVSARPPRGRRARDRRWCGCRADRVVMTYMRSNPLCMGT